MPVKTVEATPVSEPGADHGEAPLWHPVDHRLDWVDITRGLLHRYDPASGTDETIELGTRVGCFAGRAVGGFVLAVEDGFSLLDRDGTIRKVAEVDHDPGHATRMNDGKCDQNGSFWAGSMAYDCAAGHGALYRLDPSFEVTRVLSGVTISNGIDWSDDGRMFFIDTLAGGSFWDVWSGVAVPGVDEVTFDQSTRALIKRRRMFDTPVAHDVPAGMTIPDGMTVDAAGFLWIAFGGDGEVRRYSPDGQLAMVVKLPVACPTSVAFGGDDLSDLYITTMTPHGAPGPDPRQPASMWPPKPLEGALFHCRPGATGRPPNTFGRT